MKIKYSLITRRTFLNSVFGGWLAALFSGSLFSLARFAYPTVGKEPDFVVLNKAYFLDIPVNTTKPFAWGGNMGLILKKEDGTLLAFKGVCTHMECNVTYKPEEKKFYCPCHAGWYDDNGKNIAGPPPKPLESFDYKIEGEKLIVAKKGINIEVPKA
jgi:Rieske Fe-S protein